MQRLKVASSVLRPVRGCWGSVELCIQRKREFVCRYLLHHWPERMKLVVERWMACLQLSTAWVQILVLLLAEAVNAFNSNGKSWTGALNAVWRHNSLVYHTVLQPHCLKYCVIKSSPNYECVVWFGALAKSSPHENQRSMVQPVHHTLPLYQRLCDVGCISSIGTHYVARRATKHGWCDKYTNYRYSRTLFITALYDLIDVIVRRHPLSFTFVRGFK